MVPASRPAWARWPRSSPGEWGSPTRRSPRATARFRLRQGSRADSPRWWWRFSSAGSFSSSSRCPGSSAPPAARGGVDRAAHGSGAGGSEEGSGAGGSAGVRGGRSRRRRVRRVRRLRGRGWRRRIRRVRRRGRIQRRRCRREILMDEAIKRLVSPVLDKAQAVLGTGFAIVLYGSAARGEYRPGVSDINLLLVADTLTPAVLRSLSGVLDELRRERQPPPLLIERNEWARAVDVFPIEVTDMQLAREVLRGTDPVAGLRVDPADLRHALEQELRGKLLRLRQVYALHAADARALGGAAARTGGAAG